MTKRPSQNVNVISLQALNDDHRAELLKVAADLIRGGFGRDTPPPVDLDPYPAEMLRPRAAFVTLYLRGSLQGCIGSIQAVRPLVSDVAKNAFAAAFHDPRGVALRPTDVDELGIGISVLSRFEIVVFESEADLLAQIRPGIDGLLIEVGGLTGTLLPAVWKNLPEPRHFFNHVKLKAGLPADFFSSSMIVKRYTTEYFSNKAGIEE